jgi:hypothetical protein
MVNNRLILTKCKMRIDAGGNMRYNLNSYDTLAVWKFFFPFHCKQDVIITKRQLFSAEFIKITPGNFC